MFRKHESSRKRSSLLPIVILRMGLSFCILAVFAFGVYQAFRYFTGESLTDLTKMKPRDALVLILSSGDIAKTITTLFGEDISKKVLPEPQFQPQQNPSDSSKQNSLPAKPAEGKLVLKFAVMADSHKDNDNLDKALAQAKGNGAELIVGLGDYSSVGAPEELEKAKQVFKNSGLPVYLTAGDHDLWDSRNQGQGSTTNFTRVFGSPYQTFTASNIRFILLFNGDNYEGVDEVQMAWLEDFLHKTTPEPARATFVFLHEPIYHPTSDRFMGAAQKTDEGKEPNKELLKQAENLRDLFKRAGINEIFAGDIHAYSRYEDTKYGLKMTTSGAVTTERNSEKPRYLMVDVYENGGYNILDTEIQ